MPVTEAAAGVDSEVLSTFFAHASDAAMVINRMRRILELDGRPIVGDVPFPEDGREHRVRVLLGERLAVAPERAAGD